MIFDIDKILRKRKWTGEEVGKALLASLIFAYKESLAGRPGRTLFSQEQYQKMISSLESDDEYNNYNAFVGLNNWTIASYNTARTNYLRAEKSIQHITGCIHTVLAIETHFKSLEQMPLIYTERQYKEERQRRREKAVHRKHSAFQIITAGITFFLQEMEKHPRKANPLKAIKKEYAGQNVVSPYVRRAIPATDGLPKWEVLKELKTFYLDEPVAEAEGREQMRDFYKHFKELAEAMAAETDKRYKLGITKLPVEKWAEPLYEAGKLYELDVYGMKEKIEQDAYLFQDETRAKAGIAIVRPVDAKPGHEYAYIETFDFDFEQISTSLGLERYMEGCPARERNIRELIEAREDIMDGYHACLAYDTALQLIADFIGMKDFVIFTIHSEELEEKIKRLNDFMWMAHKNIEHIEYPTTVKKMAKLDVMDTYFTQFDLQQAAIKPSGIEKAKKLMEGMEAFLSLDGLLMDALVEG